MADDPWAAFPVVQPAGAPAADSAPAPAAAAAPAAGGSDPWAAFPVLQAAGSPTPASTNAPVSAAVPDTSAPQAPWTLQSAVLPYINGAARTVANSVPLVGDLADKLDAKTDALLHGGSYDQALAGQKKQDKDFADQNPVTASAAGFAGAAGGTVAMLPEWGLGAVGGLGSRVVGSTVGGTTLGTADALVRGEDPGTGAVAGGIGGMAGPLVGKGLGAAYRGVTGLMQSAPASLPNTGRIATSWLRDGVAGMAPEDLAAAKDAVGPAGMFMEMSPKLQDYAGSVADNNSDGKAVVRGALDDRFAGRNDRVNGLVDQNLGPMTNPSEMKAATQDQISQLGAQRADMLSNAGPVDASGVVQGLQNAQGRYAPNSQERSAIAKGLGWVTEPAKPAVSHWELDPAGPVSAPEAPATLPDAPTFGDQAAPSKPGPVGVPRPQDLHSFVRSLGGIQDRGGDLASMGYQNLAARPGQGLGADAMRQAAAQMGYLGPDIDHATANTSVNDLLDALGSDNPIHSVYDQDAAAQWAARDAAMADYQQRGGNSSYPTARPTAPPRAPGIPTPDPGFDPTSPTGLMAPIQDATQLHSAKQSFDRHIDWNGSPMADPNNSIGYAEGAFKQARGGINDALRAQVDGYGLNQDAQAALFGQNRALDAGMEDLRANKDPARYPPNFAQEFDALMPEQQAARRAGQRFDIGASLGNKENDFAATRQILQGDEGWNRQNLGKSFGEEPVGNVAKGLQQEAQMAANRQKIAGGSPTGEKVQRSRLTQPGGQSEGLLGAAKDWWNELYIDKPSTYLPTGQIAGRLMSGAYERARNEIAPHLVKSGPEADALFQALLAQRQRQALMSPPAAVDPLVRALTMGAGQYLRQ